MNTKRALLFISIICIVAFGGFYFIASSKNQEEADAPSFYQSQSNPSVIKINREFRQDLFNIKISDEKDRAEIKAQIYPQNVYLGDFIYIAIYLENKTHSGIACPDNNYTPYVYLIRHSGKDLQENIIVNNKNEAHFLNELLKNEHVKISAPERSVSESPPAVLPPGNQFLADYCDFQIPPPKDFHNEFWKKIRLESAHTSIPMDIVFVFDNIYITTTVNVISRDEKEYQTLLHYSDTYTSLSDKQLLKLEKELKPSTFRDSIRSYRFNRQYRQSKVQSDGIRNEILKWNNSLPEVQMIQSECIILKQCSPRRHEPVPLENYEGYFEKPMPPINLMKPAGKQAQESVTDLL